MVEVMFSPRSLKFIDKDILGLLMRTKQRNRFLEVMIDRIPRLIQAISVAKIAASNVPTVVLGGWIILRGAEDIILTGSGKQTTSKFFAAQCTLIDTKLITLSEYHS